MARTPNPIRPETIRLSLPETTLARLDLELFSPLEGKVPYGARTKFVQRLVEDYFQRKDTARKGQAA